MSPRTSSHLPNLAIVTGTTSGVGFAVANLLLERGWEVVGIARRTSPIDHARYRHIELDLSDLPRVASTFEERLASVVADDRREIVALVNNAANPALLGPMASFDLMELAATHAVNLSVPVWCMGFMSRHRPRDRALRIVNVSSGAAVRAFPGLSAYASAKAGLRMAGMALAAEWESTVPNAPTRVNGAILSYEPGAVDTPMQELARSRSTEAFPWVGMFTGMRDRGMLVPPERPAAEIVEFLESRRVEGFSERRLST